jgi:hypothetical protein
MEEAKKAAAKKAAESTFWKELKTMIPGTAEYKAEQEELRKMFEDESIGVSTMPDPPSLVPLNADATFMPRRQRIEKELKKCAAVEKLLEDRRFFTALRRLKREMQFSEYTDFQKVKWESEQKGEWDYKPRPKVKAKQLTMFEKMTDMLAPVSEESEQPAEAKPEEGLDDFDFSQFEDKSEANLVCSWRQVIHGPILMRVWEAYIGCCRAKGPEDRWFQCTNAKAMHINLTRLDIYGRTRPVFMHHCKWHLKTCHNDHGMRFVRVAEPNEKGKDYPYARPPGPLPVT